MGRGTIDRNGHHLPRNRALLVGGNWYPCRYCRALHRVHRRLAYTSRRKRLNKPIRRRRRAIRRWFRPSIKPTLFLAMVILTTFELMFGLGSIYGMVVLPTLLMGQHDAHRMAATGFTHSPQTVAKNPEGKLIENASGRMRAVILRALGTASREHSPRVCNHFVRLTSTGFLASPQVGTEYSFEQRLNRLLRSAHSEAAR